jgi:Tfp pilus assembly protein PilO
MKQLNSILARGVASGGWPAIAGVVLLVAVAGFYFSALRPEQARLEQLRQEAANLQHRAKIAQVDLPKSPSEQLAEFYRYFPTPDSLPDQLEKLFGAAKTQGLALEQGEYRPLKESAGGLTRFQVILPLRGTYPQIRKFVDGSLAEVPTLSLESIQFERQKVGDPAVEAKARFVVYLGRRT